MIGGERQRGISGGEKRRVSIAVELIRNPGNYLLYFCFCAIIYHFFHSYSIS